MPRSDSRQGNSLSRQGKKHWSDSEAVPYALRPITRAPSITRQHPQGGGREALSNPFWFLFIVNVQYEYNWIRLRQLMYLVRSQKWIKNGTLEPGISALKSVSGGPFFGHLLIWPDAGARRRTLAPGGPEERNRRFAQ